MDIQLLRAGTGDAQELHAMQVEAFRALLVKYQDFDTSPAAESIEKVECRLQQEFTYYYFICFEARKVGRSVSLTGRKKAYIRGYLRFTFYRDTRDADLHSRRSGCVKGYTVKRAGSWTRSYRRRRTVICTKRWDTEGQGNRKSSMIN